MRRLPLLVACCVALACNGATDETDDAAPWPVALPPIGCVLPTASPAEPRMLPDTDRSTWYAFGPCGHLLLEENRLLDPTLSHATPIEGGSLPWMYEFAPTGEALLSRQVGPITGYLDLAHGIVRPFDAQKAGFVPKRDRTGSFIWWCNEQGLFARDGNANRHLAASAHCDGPIVSAAAAPVLLFTNDENRIVAVDLERPDDLLETDLAARWGKAPGYPAERHATYFDLLHLSRDGRFLLHQRVIALIVDSSYVYEVEPELRLVDLWQEGRTELHHLGQISVIDETHLGRPLSWHTRGNEITTFVLGSDLQARSVAGTLHSLHGPQVLGSTSGADGHSWFWFDLTTGATEPIDLPLAEAGKDLLVSEDGRSYVVPSTRCSDCTQLYHPSIGWRALDGGKPFWLGNDGAVLLGRKGQIAYLTPDGEERLTIDRSHYGRVIANEEVGILVVTTSDRGIHVIDRAAMSVQTIGAEAVEPLVDAAGRRIAWREITNDENWRTPEAEVWIAPLPSSWHMAPSAPLRRWRL